MNDKLTEISFYNRKEKLTGKIFVAYNADEKPIRIIKYGDDRTLLPGELMGWQKLLFPLFEKLFNFFLTLHALYKLFARREFKKAGQCLIYGTPLDETFITYEKDKLIEVESVSTFTPGGTAVFKYDEKGNRTEEIAYLGNGFISHQEKSEYKYDLDDNWIEKKTFYKLPKGDMKQFMERTVLTYRTIECYSESCIKPETS